MLAALIACEREANLPVAPASPPRSSFVRPEDCPEVKEPAACTLAGLLGDNRFEELEAQLDDLQRAYESNALCEGYLWDAFESLGSSEPERIEALGKWIEARPMSHAALIARGHALKESGYAARGGKFVKDTPPENFRRMRDRFAVALEDSKAAIELAPRHVVPYGTIVEILRASGNHEEAIRVAKRFEELDPRSYGLRRILMRALYPHWGGSLAAMQRVADDAQQYAHLNPLLRILLGFVPAYRAQQAVDAGNNDEALELYSEALEYGDSGIAWVIQRARIYTSKKRWREALRDANRALEAKPDLVEALEIRAVILAMHGNIDGAIQDMDRILEISPNHPWASSIRAELSQRPGHQKRQEAALRRGVETMPDDS